MLIQDVFFSLFDSAAKVTIYFICTFAASCFNAGLFLSGIAAARSNENAKRRNTRTEVAQGVMIVLVGLWSFWAFVSALASIQIIFFGLPLLWSTYTAGNLINLAASIAATVSFINSKNSGSGKNRKLSRLIAALARIARAMELPIGIAVITSGLLTITDAALYSLGILVM